MMHQPLRIHFSMGYWIVRTIPGPEDFHGMKVPEVLLQGNHEEIRRWRLKESLGRTWLRRPDLLEKVSLSKEQEKIAGSTRQRLESSTVDGLKLVGKGSGVSIV